MTAEHEPDEHIPAHPTDSSDEDYAPEPLPDTAWDDPDEDEDADEPLEGEPGYQE